MNINSIKNITYSHLNRTTNCYMTVIFDTGEIRQFRGKTRKHPLDKNVPAIGDNLAFDRALEKAKQYIANSQNPWEKAGGLQDGDMIVVAPYDVTDNTEWMDYGVVVKGTIVYKNGGWDRVSTYDGGSSSFDRISFIFRPNNNLNTGFDYFIGLYKSYLDGDIWPTGFCGKVFT